MGFYAIRLLATNTDFGTRNYTDTHGLSKIYYSNNYPHIRVSLKITPLTLTRRQTVGLGMSVGESFNRRQK